MKRPRLVVAVFIFAAFGCNSPEQPPPAEPAYRAFQEISAAISVGVDKVTYDQLLRDAALELLILQDLATDSAAIQVLKFYRSAFQMYEDAGALWDAQMDTPDFVRSGWIYEPDSAVVAQYDLHMERQKARFREYYFQATPESSIQAVWTKAQSVADSGNAVVVPILKQHYR